MSHKRLDLVHPERLALPLGMPVAQDPTRVVREVVQVAEGRSAVSSTGRGGDGTEIAVALEMSLRLKHFGHGLKARLTLAQAEGLGYVGRD